MKDVSSPAKLDVSVREEKGEGWKKGKNGRSVGFPLSAFRFPPSRSGSERALFRQVGRTTFAMLSEAAEAPENAPITPYSVGV